MMLRVLPPSFFFFFLVERPAQKCDGVGVVLVVSHRINLLATQIIDILTASRFSAALHVPLVLVKRRMRGRLVQAPQIVPTTTQKMQDKGSD